MSRSEEKKELPIPGEYLQELLAIMSEEITERPPTVGLVGISGVGKSYTINMLFKTKLATSDTVACTKQFRNINLSLQFTRGQMKREPVSLRVFDAPGLGENVFHDPGYLEQYQAYLEVCDVVLWVMAARNRAAALDQLYLQKLQRFHQKMVFAINQVDLVEPMGWRERLNIPSKRQEENIKIIEADRAEKMKAILGSTIPIVSYSARRGYRLELLFKTILEACPLERLWIFEGLKNFSYRDFLFGRNATPPQ